MTNSRETTRTAVCVQTQIAPVLLVLAGLILLINPLYVDSVSVYPGHGWADLPLFVSGLTTLGFLCVGVTAGSLFGVLDSPRHLLSIAVLSILLFPLYNQVVLLLYEPTVEPISGFFFKQLLIASLIAGFFASGRLLTLRGRWAPAGFLVTIPFLALAILDWQFDPILGLVLDLYFFATAPVLFGIPYLGTVMVLASFLLGIGLPPPSDTPVS